MPFESHRRVGDRQELGDAGPHGLGVGPEVLTVDDQHPVTTDNVLGLFKLVDVLTSLNVRVVLMARAPGCLARHEFRGGTIYPAVLQLQSDLEASPVSKPACEFVCMCGVRPLTGSLSRTSNRTSGRSRLMRSMAHGCHR